MNMILILLLLLSIFLLFSLRIMLKRFDKLECLIYYLFTSFLCQHINFKIFGLWEIICAGRAYLQTYKLYTFWFGLTLFTSMGFTNIG